MSVIVHLGHYTEVDQGHTPPTIVGGQALFNAIGFNGVSDPDDKDDVEDGDSLEVFVSPKGVEEAAAKLALVSIEDDKP